MDAIDSLPNDDGHEETPDELNILNEYFAKASKSTTSMDHNVSSAFHMTILFLALANPLTDKLMELVPHMGTSLVRMGVKLILFFIVSYILIARS
uniref:Uncharacterized protein n=1 Tax=viral metagenome TaxID=1070528 RepID=A0A6C0LZU5_9ZZZZ